MTVFLVRVMGGRDAHTHIKTPNQLIRATTTVKTRLGIGLNVPKTGLEIDATLLLSLIPFQSFLAFLSSYGIVIIIFSLSHSFLGFFVLFSFFFLLGKLPEFTILLRKGTCDSPTTLPQAPEVLLKC